MKRRGQHGTWRTVLKVFLMQEPLVEPRLIAILDNIKQVNRHCKITVYSNMATMTEQKAREIIKSRYIDKLCVSFYGVTEEIYKQIQPPLNWKRTKHNIRRFMELRNKSGQDKPQVEMHYIAAPQLMKHCYSFSCEWDRVADRVGFVHYDDFHGVMPRLSDNYTNNMWGSPAPERTPCSRLWTGLNVLCDGTVTPCCVDFDGTVQLGNVNDDTLQNIWVDTPFQQFREAHVHREFQQIPLCRDCKIWQHQHPEGWNDLWLEKPTLLSK